VNTLKLKENVMMFLNGWLKLLGRSLVLSYIDAGTGSLVIQVLIGMVAGGLLALKLTWKKLKSRFKHGGSSKEKLNEGQDHVIEH
jgi:hypothetical protein